MATSLSVTPSTTPTSLPSESSTPSPITDKDHGPLVIIAAGITLGAAIIILSLRLIQCWPWRSLFKLEDALLVLATLFSIGNVAAVAVAVQHGLGQHVDDLTTPQMQRTKQGLVTSFALTYVIEGLSAISFALLLRGMNPNRLYRKAMIGIIAVVVCWSLAGVIRFAVAVQVGVADPEIDTWIGFGVVFCIMQVTLMSSAWFMIWTLQMPTSRKLGSSLWFSLCLPNVAVTIIRLLYTPEQTFGLNFTWEDTNMTIILLIEANLAIINAAYPSVRSFLNKVSTGFIVAETAKDSVVRSNDNSYALRSIGGGRMASRTKDHSLSLGGHKSTLHHSTVAKGDARSDKSFGSEVIMVRRSVDIEEASMTDN